MKTKYSLFHFQTHFSSWECGGGIPRRISDKLRLTEIFFMESSLNCPLDNCGVVETRRCQCFLKLQYNFLHITWNCNGPVYICYLDYSLRHFLCEYLVFCCAITEDNAWMAFLVAKNEGLQNVTPAINWSYSRNLTAVPTISIATSDIFTSDLVSSEKFLMSDVLATNL